MPVQSHEVEKAVKERYSKSAAKKEAKLCCAIDYNPDHLKAIPQEILEKDYGCGNPSKYVRSGETVLDLGSGAGKICYIAAQVVGKDGYVVGVDMNDDMLSLARKYQPDFHKNLGFENVDFRKGKIQDLKTNLELLEKRLQENPVKNLEDYNTLQAYLEETSTTQPLVKDESVDVVVSNCVLNLVAPSDKKQMFREIYRVLRNTGRAVISDIVSSQEVPEELQKDPNLWSGCISGALTEYGFLHAFMDAGFKSVRILSREVEPWQVEQGIEFRSVTVAAYKGDAELSGQETNAPETKCCS